MRHLISVLLAGSFLLGAGAAEANNCNIDNYFVSPVYTGCTAQERQTYAEMAEERERALAKVREKNDEIERQATSSVLPLFIISAILAIIALFMEFGLIGAAGWFGVCFFGSICLVYAWLGNPGSGGAGAARLIAFGSCIAVL